MSIKSHIVNGQTDLTVPWSIVTTADCELVPAIAGDLGEVRRSSPIDAADVSSPTGAGDAGRALVLATGPA